MITQVTQARWRWTLKAGLSKDQSSSLRGKTKEDMCVLERSKNIAWYIIMLKNSFVVHLKFKFTWTYFYLATLRYALKLGSVYILLGS